MRNRKGCVVFLLSYFLCSGFGLESSKVVIVVLSQDNPYHKGLAQELRRDLEGQADSLPLKEAPLVKVVPEDLPHPGAWTVIPILPRIDKLYGGNNSWIYFCEERTVVRLQALLEGLDEYDHTKEHWLGYGLFDHEPSIIHHFAFAENPMEFKYPLFPAGFAITTTLLKRIASNVRKKRVEPSDFSIDASHELALFIGVNTSLVNAPDLFCVKKKKSCASYPNTEMSCGKPIDKENLFFAVKTYHKFHENRVPVVQKTWGKTTAYIEFFSDLQNKSIPTTNVGIENTERGHCSKTVRILEMVLERINMNKDISWVILSDDDTILSVPRLQAILPCFRTNSVVGERYGYNVKQKTGYNYITGGGGIAFGVESLPLIVKHCRCPADDTPDDMFLGLCLTRLKIPILHSPLFHQARPMDYADGYLESQKPVSFHKHWMVDPITVYNQWFSGLDHEITHTEL